VAAEQLVRTEIDAGLNLVRALDDAHFGVVGALWLYYADADRWRFVIAADAAPKDIEKKYLEAATIVSQWREAHPAQPVLDLARVRIVSQSDPLIRGLQPIIRVDGLSEIRFSNNVVNGIYVEDALIHRMAA
jgi:hypothetical protein